MGLSVWWYFLSGCLVPCSFQGRRSEWSEGLHERGLFVKSVAPVKQCEIILSSLPPKCTSHIHPQWDYTELMNRFWCPLFADWLERNNMNCSFRDLHKRGFPVKDNTTPFPSSPHPLARFICTVCIHVGSGDPVRILCLFHNKYTGCSWSIYCWDYVQLVAIESNVLLY